MSNRKAKDFLQDILEACQRIIAYTTSIDYQTFLKDEKTQDAGIRNLEILGEAAKNLPAEFKQDHTNLPWNQMARTRDRLIPHYFGVNLDIVWGIIQEELTGLRDQLHEILSGME